MTYGSARTATTATAAVSARAIPWQLEGVLLYNVKPYTKVNEDREPRTYADAQSYVDEGWNVGLPLGLNNFVDIEDDGETEAERQAALEWIDSLGLPPTFTWSSLKGLHRLFRVPPGLDLHKRNPEKGIKVQFLAGPNYTLIPPSVADGVARVVTNDVEVAQLPDSVLELFTAPPVASEKGSIGTRDLSLTDGEVISVGERNERLFDFERAAIWSRAWWKNVDPSQMIHEDAIYNVPCEENLDPGEIETIKRSADKPEYGIPECKINPTVFVGKHYPELSTKEHIFMEDLISHALVWVDRRHLEVERSVSLIVRNTSLGKSVAWEVKRALVAKGLIRVMEDSEPTVRKDRTGSVQANRYLIPIPDAENDPTLWGQAAGQTELRREEKKDSSTPPSPPSLPPLQTTLFPVCPVPLRYAESGESNAAGVFAPSEPFDRDALWSSSAPVERRPAELQQLLALKPTRDQAAAIILDAKEDKCGQGPVYEGKLPECNEKRIELATELLSSAIIAYRAGMRGEEVTDLIKLAGITISEDGDLVITASQPFMTRAEVKAVRAGEQLLSTVQ